jgi:hypothetical protein
MGNLLKKNDQNNKILDENFFKQIDLIKENLNYG